MYPIGIPALYATILWQNRELLNPRIHSHAKPDPDDGPLEAEIGADPVSTTSKGQTKKGYSAEELQELEDKVEARKVHPDLVPSMFLWKDFGKGHCSVICGVVMDSRYFSAWGIASTPVVLEPVG